MESFDLIIIGGCASGLVAAINASRLYPGIKIAILERMPRIGKKILATGNGRCNLSNLHAAEHPYTNADFAQYALNKYSVKETLRFFESLGLLTYSDSEGRIYPLSNTAASVLDALRFAVNTENINIYCDYEVKTVKKAKNGFTVNSEFFSKKLILAAGGKASPSQGANGSGYLLAKQLGHSLTDLCPSLTALNADQSVTKPLKGVRVHSAELSIYDLGGNQIKRKGELLFTDYGISGIAAMELASTVERIKAKGVKMDAFTTIDFLPDMSHESLCKYIKNLCISTVLRDFDSLLTGLLPKAVGIAICKAVSLYNSSNKIAELTDFEIENLAAVSKAFPLRITSSRGFDTAQVTCGGIKTDEINKKTMESVICPDLFIAGEIADVDGNCGGFNLQWAWSSGLLAGELGGKL